MNLAKKIVFIIIRVSEAKIWHKKEKNVVPRAKNLHIIHLAKKSNKKIIRNVKIDFGGTGENYESL